jgi:isochorismate hydrolase
MPGIPEIKPYALPSAGDLPANTASWTPDPRRAVLLVHDAQRFFLRPLPAATLRSDLTGNIARLLTAARGAGVPVAYTAQPGGMTDEQRGLLQDFWGPGMRVDPADRAIADELTPAAGDWRLTKWRYSAFFRSGLLERLREAGRDQLVLCGVYAHVGVLMTAVEAFSHDIETFLAADAVADFSEADHWMALEYAARRCAVVQVTDRLVADLDHRGKPGA